MEGTKVYTFMVRFRDKPQVFRMIQIDGGKSLEDLHYAILEAFDFTPEHSYIFSRNQVLYDPKGCAASDNGSGKTENEVCLEKLGWELKETWLYLYDFDNEWMFDVTLMKTEGGQDQGSSQAVREKRELEKYPDSEEDWEEESEFDRPVEVVCSRKSMKSIMGQRDEEELKKLLKKLGMEIPEAENRKKKADVYAAALIDVLEGDKELMMKLFTGRGGRFLAGLAGERTVTLGDCMMHMNEMDMYHACGLVDLENIGDAVIGLTKEGREYAALCGQEKWKACLEEKERLEKLLSLLVDIYGAAEVGYLYSMLNMYQEDTLDPDEFYEGIAALAALWNDYTEFRDEDSGQTYLSILDREEIAYVLKQRKRIGVKGYKPFCREKMEAILENGVSVLIPSVRRLLDCLQTSGGLDYDASMMLAMSFVQEVSLNPAPEAALAMGRELLEDWGIEPDNNVEELLKLVAGEAPSALLMGYSIEEYKKLLGI